MAKKSSKQRAARAEWRDRDAVTIVSTKKTINKVMLILARGYARRTAGGPGTTGRRWTGRALVLVAAVVLYRVSPALATIVAAIG